jgi:tRNA pseudouridine synthase 10
LAGRYQKYSRTLSQTAWLIEDEGKKRVKTSIEEIMGNSLKTELSAKGRLIQFNINNKSLILILINFVEEFIFTASGREDIDVKCLGDGRPFILEFFEPKRTEFTKQELKHYQKVNKNFYN